MTSGFPSRISALTHSREESELPILDWLDSKTLRLFGIAVPILALAVLNRLTKGRRFMPVALTLAAPLLVLLLDPPTPPYRDEPARTVGVEDYLFEYTLMLVLSVEALAISRFTIRFRWAGYLILCSTLTLVAWILSTCSLGLLVVS